MVQDLEGEVSSLFLNSSEIAAIIHCEGSMNLYFMRFLDEDFDNEQIWSSKVVIDMRIRSQDSTPIKIEANEAWSLMAV